MPKSSLSQLRASKKYRDANKEKYNTHSKTFYQNNKELVKLRNKSYYQRKKAEALLSQQSTAILVE